MSSLIPHLSVVPTWQSATSEHLASRVVVVIDVLRWSTVVVTALSNGAESVEAFETPELALQRAEAIGRHTSILGGERGGLTIRAFDVGNSPAEYSRERVQRKVVVTTTTNGTHALSVASTEGAHQVRIAALVNLSATVAVLRDALAAGRAVTLLCAGQDGVEALEDIAGAGAIVDALLTSGSLAERETDPNALRARDLWVTHQREPAVVFAAAPHAQSLRALGFAADLDSAGRTDHFAISPLAVAGRIVVQ